MSGLQARNRLRSACLRAAGVAAMALASDKAYVAAEAEGVMRVLRTPGRCFEHLPDFPFQPHYAEVRCGQLRCVEGVKRPHGRSRASTEAESSFGCTILTRGLAMAPWFCSSMASRAVSHPWQE